ncbi:MAG: Lon protease-like protein [Flavobacteriales bacterium]|jgi:Lon protease-like protein
MTTATLPLFPLELVCFPGELLALHIFEDRYQQLIKDCEQEELTFGVPAYINAAMEFGTEVRLEKVVKRYESGASDVLCRGLRVFKLEKFYSVLDTKLYAGGEVMFQANIADGVDLSVQRFRTLLLEFYQTLDLELPAHDPQKMDSFTFTHKLGLTLEQEYEFLKIASESDRYQFLIYHLSRVIPTVKAVNRTKELVRLNGHFKNFNPLDFKGYKL